MNQIPTTPSSSTATPPHRLQYPPRPASNSSSNTRSTPTLTPAIIPLDYNYQTMSPSSITQFRSERIPSATTTASNAYHLHSHTRLSSARPSAHTSVDVELDNQYSSLFGDPVPPPPPPDFLTSQFDPVSLFRTSSLEISSGSDEDAMGRLATLATERPSQTRLFSHVPFSSVFSRRTSDTTTQRNFDVLPTPMPRLQPPDIQILPNSSGGSSSETHESPNYALLLPNDKGRRPSEYEQVTPTDVTEIIETLEVRDAQGVRDYSEAKRRVSNFSADFKSNVGSLSNTQDTVVADSAGSGAQHFPQQYAHDSYTNNEWFRPATQDYPEFSKIPKMRPSSKNIMSIKREEMPMHHSPVATMINDSNESSSGEEQRAQTVDHAMIPPARPPDPSPSLLREIQSNLFPAPEDYLQQRSAECMDNMEQQHFPTPPPPAAPPPPEYFSPTGEDTQNANKREISPVILRDLIATGGDFRVDQPRLHKKTSFTIISEKSPQSSRAQSPSSQRQTTPSKISAPASSSIVKPVAKPRQYLQRKSLSSTQLKLPQLPQQKLQTPADDSPRPSVQFNMTGRHTPNMMTQRGILQHRESLSSSQDITPLSPAAKSRLRRPSVLPTFAKYADKSKMKSCEALPLITDPYRTSIPRFNRSKTDLQREPAVFPPGALPRPLKPNPNPTRKQKGLLRILNGDQSHIPLRSNWASMDDLTLGRKMKTAKLTPIKSLQNRRRSSSTSPERRSSTQTASDRRSSNLSSITTSDFSFRRPSVVAQQSRKTAHPTPSPQVKRRQSLIPAAASLAGGRTSRAKLVKPSTLSPIIGTPNKDGSNPQSPEQNGIASLAPSETPSEATSRRDSLTKIPVRATHSRAGTRSSSPLKEFAAQLPLYDSNSRGTSSRTASRATARTDVSQAASRTNSRPGSRSNSRASTRPISRATSRASTRPNSRMEMAKEIANSRSNSRMSTRSNVSTAEKATPSPQSMRRRKSVSVSPVLNRKSRERRQSLSPPNKKRAGSRGRGKKVRDGSESRRNSQSRIPLRAGSVTKVKRTSPKPNVGKGANSRSPPKSTDVKNARKIAPTQTRESQRRKTISAKKAPTSVLKPESSVKRAASNVSKQPTGMKKQPSNLQQPLGTNLRRAASNLQKKDGKIAGKDGAAAGDSGKKVKSSSTTAAVAVAASGLKRQAISKSMRKVNAKAAAPASKGKEGAKKTATGPTDASGVSTKTEKATKTGAEEASGDKAGEQQVTGESLVGMEATKVGAAPSAVAAAGVAASNAVRASANISSSSTGSTAGSTTALKRNASNVSLKRMASRMSLLSMKRSDSNLSRRKAVSAVAEETSEGSKSNEKRATPKKTDSRTQMHAAEDASAAAMLEKSQKTLENIQMTVTNATDEIHKTINEKLTDLKNLETDMGLFSDSAGSPTSSVTTVVENQIGGKAAAVVAAVGSGTSVSRSGTAEGAAAKAHQNVTNSGARTQKSPLAPTQPVEANVAVLNASGQATAAAAAAAAATSGALAMPHAAGVDGTIERNYAYDGDGEADKTADGAAGGRLIGDELHGKSAVASGNGPSGIGGDGDADDDIKRRSPDGQGGSPAGSGNGSREFLKAPEDDSTPPPGCCRCCSTFCLPCRRLRCGRCCRRKISKTGDESEEPVLSATSTASTTNLEVIDEVQHAADEKTKTGCWQKLNCCKSCRKQKKNGVGETDENAKMTAAGKMETTPAAGSTTPTKQGKCGLCMSKLFCCRRVNKVDPTTGDETELKKCCFCIPCRRKKGGHGATIGSTVSPTGSVAWQDPESGIAATDASVLEGAAAADMEPPQGCCKRFWTALCCCCRKKVPKPSESRRASIKAPPPPSEDTRRKLHVDLVEYNSKMKGAIPVLPLTLAWFCAICNTVFPGLGTLFSGIFCLCVGIPRFSQYDSAKARFGSFIINIIVSVAQLFCVLFCFVGWGWSIWWGTIMLKCARKLSKIKKVEKLEMEEERRQAQAAATAAATAARTAANTAPAATTTESAA